MKDMIVVIAIIRSLYQIKEDAERETEGRGREDS
jgi:hypothetical protein